MKNNADFGYDMSLGFEVFGVEVFGTSYKQMTPMQVGLDYITRFFKSSLFTGNKNPNVYIGLMAKKLGATTVNRQIESLGTSIQLAGLSKLTVQESAESLAEIAGNRYPANLSDFRFALINQATSTPFTDAIVDSAVIKEAQKVGDSLINVGKAGLAVAEATVESAGFFSKIVAYFPYIVPVGGAYLLYKFLTSDYFKEISKSAVGAYAGKARLNPRKKRKK